MKIKIFFLLTFASQILYSQEWKTDFNEAKKEALDTNKSLVLVFQGSDWCAPCIKLEQNIWSHKDFLNYAAEHLIMVKADFPRKKKNQLSDEQTAQNRTLAERYNKKGFFPLVVVFNSKNEIIGTTGYDKDKSPADYVNLIKSFESNEN